MQFRNFLKSKFVKNVATLSSGSIVSQGIAYASILILTRLFSAEAFGIYVLFTSILFILRPLSTLQYEFTLILPKNRIDAINLFALTLLVLFFTSLLLLLIIMLFDDFILSLFNIQELSYFIFFIPPTIFIFGCISAIEKWNNRLDNYHIIAKGQVVKSISTSGSQILSSFSKFSSLGLITGLIIGYAFHFIFLILKSLQSLQSIWNEVSFHKMKSLAKQYTDVPKFNTAISFINTLANELPVLFLSSFFGVSKAGFFGLASKFIKAPVGIFQQSVYQVFYNKASITFHENSEQLKFLVDKTVKNLFIIGLVLFLPLFILSFFLDFIFGSEWEEVGNYARVILPWLFVSFINQPISSLSLILNKQKIILWIVTLFLCFRFAALYLGYVLYNDAIIAVGFFSLVGVFMSLTVLLYLVRVSKNPVKAYVS